MRAFIHKAVKGAGESGLNQRMGCKSKSTVREINFADALQSSTEHDQEDVAQGEEIEMEEFM